LLGLKVVPLGLTYSAKERYRSDVVVHFGEPILAAEFLREYAVHRKECIRRLTAEIEARLRSLIVVAPQLERARVLAGVKRLYLDRLRLGNRVVQEPMLPGAQELLLTRAISGVVDYEFEHHPERARAFTAKLDAYEARLRRLRLSDEALKEGQSGLMGIVHKCGLALLAVIGLPVALYGWVHRLLPFLLVRFATAKFVQPGKRKAQAATTAITAGILGFGFFYLVYVLVVHALFGWPISLWYALTLPVASLLAHYYTVHLVRLFRATRDFFVCLRAPMAVSHLTRTRRELISEIEKVRVEMPPLAQVPPRS
jgi:hypothetical protein